METQWKRMFLFFHRCCPLHSHLLQQFNTPFHFLFPMGSSSLSEKNPGLSLSVEPRDYSWMSRISMVFIHAQPPFFIWKKRMIPGLENLWEYNSPVCLFLKPCVSQCWSFLLQSKAETYHAKYFEKEGSNKLKTRIG